MPQLTVIADYGDLCGESPLWDPESGNLYWTDCAGLKFYRYHAASNTHELMTQGVEINGCARDTAGGFVITNNDGIWVWDGADEISLIAAEVEGTKCQMNDAIADPAGRLFAGSWFYDPTNREYPLGKLLRIDTDRSVHIVDEGITLANGLAFSPDCKTLYFTDSVVRRIYAYDYDKQSGSISNRRILVQVPVEEGLPDGLTVDAEGLVWSAQWYGGCLVRYDSEGKAERRIAVPAKQTSSVAFGGHDLADIFITSAAKSEPMPVMPAGYDPSSGCLGGQLFRINLGIEGKPEFKTNLSRTP